MIDPVQASPFAELHTMLGSGLLTRRSESGLPKWVFWPIIHPVYRRAVFNRSIATQLIGISEKLFRVQADGLRGFTEADFEEWDGDFSELIKATDETLEGGWFFSPSRAALQAARERFVQARYAVARGYAPAHLPSRADRGAAFIDLTSQRPSA